MILPKRVQSKEGKYIIRVLVGQKGENGRRWEEDNEGLGFTYDEACEGLKLQLSWVTDGYPRRVVRQGLSFLVIDDHDGRWARYWIEEIKEKAHET